MKQDLFKEIYIFFGWQIIKAILSTVGGKRSSVLINSYSQYISLIVCTLQISNHLILHITIIHKMERSVCEVIHTKSIPVLSLNSDFFYNQYKIQLPHSNQTLFTYIKFYYVIINKFHFHSIHSQRLYFFLYIYFSVYILFYISRRFVYCANTSWNHQNTYRWLIVNNRGTMQRPCTSR